MRAAWVMIVLIACGGGRSEPATPIANEIKKPPADAAVDAPTGVDGAIAKMASFKDRMCACKDKVCADALADEMNKWGMEESKHADREMRVSEDQAKRMAAITEEFSKCMTVLMMPPAGSATP